MFKRPVYKIIKKHLNEPRKFIQVLAGPRQTGKTTLARQIMDELKMPAHYASADEPTLKNPTWIQQQWEIARLKLTETKRTRKGLLILDEIQKIPGWSETVKHLWDEDTINKIPLHILALGSSPLLIESGLSESLAGRFEIIPITHWSFNEMQQAFGWTVEQYVFFGGYPGSASLIKDFGRWSRYIIDSLIETTISRDILLMKRVDKPALLRRLFELGCQYSGQILSYQKMLGQLQDAGNTTTLAHYLQLLEGAGLLAGLQQYAGQKVRQRASSPKFIVMNTALMTAINQIGFRQAKNDRDYWGRLIESAIGASLINAIRGTDIKLFYWRSQNREVDFVLCRHKTVVAIEVKSGRAVTHLPGTEMFAKQFKTTRKLLVGSGGIDIQTFLSYPIEHWLK